MLAQHKAIADAVLARDPEKACQAAEVHMAYVQSAFDAGRESQKRIRTANKRLLLFQNASRHASLRSKRVAS